MYDTNQLPTVNIKKHTRRNAAGDLVWTGYYYFDIRVKDDRGITQRHFKRGKDPVALQKEAQFIKLAKTSHKEMMRRTIGTLYPEDAVAGYLHYCKKTARMAPTTLRVKRMVLGLFAQEFRTYSVKQIGTQQIAQWLTKVSEDASRTRWYRWRKEINVFYSWLMEHHADEVKENPVAAIKTRGRKPENRQRECPTRDEVKALVKVLENGSGERKGKFTQDQSMIMFAIFTWARRKELYDLKWEHVDFAKSTYKLPAAKGNKVDYETILMNDSERELLEWQWEHRIGDEYVFQCKEGGRVTRRCDELVTKYFKKAGVTKTIFTNGGKKVVGKYGWHSLRHFGISEYVNNGGNLLAARDRARHSSTSTTELYLHSDGTKNEIGGSFDDFK